MGETIAVFFRGLIAVIGVIVLVGAVWTTYIQRDALASALAPATDLVKRLRGVPSTTQDAEPTPQPQRSAPSATAGREAGNTQGADSAAPSAPTDAPAGNPTTAPATD